MPRSFRHMHGFGSHTFSMINAANERVWVKFHFRTPAGHREPHRRRRPPRSSRNDRESNERDLFEAIEAGNFPRWTLSIQVMTEAQAPNPPAQSVRPDQGLAARPTIR